MSLLTSLPGRTLLLFACLAVAMAAGPSTAVAATPAPIPAGSQGSAVAPPTGDRPAAGEPRHDFTRPWVMQAVAVEQAGKNPQNPAPRAAVRPLAMAGTTAAATRPTREVFAFVNSGNLGDAGVGYTTWNYSQLSTIVFFGLTVDASSGQIVHNGAYNVWHSATASSFVNTAHSNGVRVVLGIIYQDLGPGMCTALNNAGATAAAAKNELMGADGVNIDYEGQNQPCPDGQSQRTKLNAFVKTLRAAGLGYLSIDTYAGSASDGAGFFDIATIAANLDSMFVMDYGMEGSNGPCSTCMAPTSPLTAGSGNPPPYTWNDTRSATDYQPWASQTILGFPWYGVKACVTSTAPNAQVVHGTYGADPYATIVSYPSDPRIQNWSASRDVYDTAGQEPWASFYSQYSNCTREEYWDDPTSLGHKYDLVNQYAFRGVGMFTLDYVGGRTEMWGAIQGHFATCPATTTGPGSPPASTNFLVSAATSPGCQITGFDVQQFDQTLNQGWFSIYTNSGQASFGLDGFPGHTYLVRSRARSVAGVYGDWSGTVTVTIPASATYAHPFKSLYTLDGWGGVHPAGSPPLAVSAYWPGWSIARAVRVMPGVPDAGLVLDGWGGLHPLGDTSQANAAVSAYWPNWDIARDFALLPDGSGGYVLDGWGGLHPFGLNGHAAPPGATGAAYWPNWDIARRVVILPDGSGGYVLDGWGGLHSFGIRGAAPPTPQVSAYWPNWDIARGVDLIPGTASGYVLDGWGGLHQFGGAGATSTPAYWPGWDIARGVWMAPGGGGYTLDGWGGLHAFGGAAPIPTSGYWPNWDIVRGLAGV